MIKEEITPLQAMQYLAMLVALDNSQIAKDTFDYFKHLVEENEHLKFKKELLEGMHDIDIKNNLYYRKVIEEQKELLEEIRNITQSCRPLNAGDITSNIKDYIKILDIFKSNVAVCIDYKGSDPNNICYLLIFKNGDQAIIKEITKEQYELLKEVLEND